MKGKVRRFVTPSFSLAKQFTHQVLNYTTKYVTVRGTSGRVTEEPTGKKVFTEELKDNMGDTVTKR